MESTADDYTAIFADNRKKLEKMQWLLRNRMIWGETVPSGRLGACQAVAFARWTDSTPIEDDGNIENDTTSLRSCATDGCTRSAAIGHETCCYKCARVKGHNGTCTGDQGDDKPYKANYS